MYRAGFEPALFCYAVRYSTAMPFDSALLIPLTSDSLYIRSLNLHLC